MKINMKHALAGAKTHEGASAATITPELQLQRSVMACLLWEDSFYESGDDVAKRIKALVARCEPEYVAKLAVKARKDMKLRHAPLLLVREMARLEKHKALVAESLERVIQRPDELTEFLAIYWKEKRQPVSAQVKKGLARAFAKFSEHQLAKYDREGTVKLRDVLFISHSKPKDATTRLTKLERKAKEPRGLAAHESLYKRIVDGQLATPDTWEVSLSAGEDKRGTFERLMAEKKLGALALLRNLRNMQEARVPKQAVAEYMAEVDLGRVLPFRFVAAARAVPKWEDVVERGMLRCLAGLEKLPGKTAIVVDNSGSMHGAKVSKRSDIDRSDAACALAVLLREVCEDVVVIGFGNDAKVMPPRRGFALIEAIKKGPGGGTMTDKALALAENEGYDRIVVVTDEQSHQAVRAPKGRGYFINVATNKNGIGYGKWVHIDGWSESILEYIRMFEAAEPE
jgi:hypothetical protein